MKCEHHPLLAQVRIELSLSVNCPCRDWGSIRWALSRSRRVPSTTAGSTDSSTHQLGGIGGPSGPGVWLERIVRDRRHPPTKDLLVKFVRDQHILTKRGGAAEPNTPDHPVNDTQTRIVSRRRIRDRWSQGSPFDCQKLPPPENRAPRSVGAVRERSELRV